jgi:tetraacyldisaccharide-1-P 4'-kinase
VLVSVERWSDRVRLLPRGPWRESPAALRRADVVVCVRKTAVESASARLAESLRVLSGRLVMRAFLRASAWQRSGRPAGPPEGDVLMVAGLADPELFAAGVRATGIDVGTELTFGDHHEYDANDAARIIRASAGRPVVTSAKDWIKLSRLIDPDRLWVLTQEMIIEEGEALLDAALARVLP